MYRIFKGKKFVTFMDNYRAAVRYVQTHPGTRMIHYAE